MNLGSLKPAEGSVRKTKGLVEVTGLVGVEQLEEE